MFYRCPFCNGKDIWQTAGVLCYFCKECQAKWGRKKSNKPRYELNEHQSMYGTFCGNWSHEDMIELEEKFTEMSIMSYYKSCWFFFKGKAIYTAWRGRAVMNLRPTEYVILGNNLSDLLQQIREKFSFLSI